MFKQSIFILQASASLHDAAAAQTAGVWCSHAYRILQNTSPGETLDTVCWPYCVWFMNTSNQRHLVFHNPSIILISSTLNTHNKYKCLLVKAFYISLVFSVNKHCPVIDVTIFNTFEPDFLCSLVSVISSCWPTTTSRTGSTTVCRLVWAALA